MVTECCMCEGRLGRGEEARVETHEVPYSAGRPKCQQGLTSQSVQSVSALGVSVGILNSKLGAGRKNARIEKKRGC